MSENSSKSREWMVKIRTDLGLTQEKAAKIVGVSLRRWQRWEHGDSTPSDNFESVVNAFPEARSHALAELAPHLLPVEPVGAGDE